MIQSFVPFFVKSTIFELLTLESETSMAQVIKVYTTKPLPSGAELISRGDKFFYAISRGGKTVLCAVTPCKTKFRIESKKWYAQYRHSDGTMKRRPAFTDKLASLKLAEDLERGRRLEKWDCRVQPIPFSKFRCPS